ncbi:hypothetical protein [Marinobacter sp.]|uniref:hypothetical protein n=1 Tax=Marinobacter sp. TaxID=50741 RepID=UPI002B465E91|nr:hypothetical protein [Marinobacter sp.]HKK57444.1 hypothetical protein [Marinobacter sp.]
MKTAASLAALLILFSPASWAQDTDYDKRNTHIFCSSHLALVIDSLDEEGRGYQALASLSRMHRDAGRTLGATKEHFDQVAGYLEKVRNDDQQKWNSLSAQSKRVCLPKSDD